MRAMRFELVAAAVMLTWCLPAAAAELAGRVVRDSKGLANAEVRVFAIEPALEGCARALGPRCLCPDALEATRAKLLAGFESPPVASAKSGADGAFTVTVPPTGRFQVSAASPDGALFGEAELKGGVEVALHETSSFELDLDGLTRGAVAWVVAPTTGEARRVELREGRGSTGPMPRDHRMLLVTSPGAAIHFVNVLGGHAMVVPPQPPGTPVMLTLVSPGKVKGTVTQGDRPVARAEVIADPDRCALRTTTDAKGGFTLAATAPPPYSTPLLARHKGRVATGLANPGRSTTLALQPAARLELTLTDAKGAPQPDVELRVANRRYTSDAKGRVVLDDLVPGPLQVSVSAPWVLVGDRSFSLSGKVKATRVVERGVTLSGRVVDAAGAGVPRVSVFAFYGDALQQVATDSMKEALSQVAFGTDDTGAFEVGPLLPGEYELVAKAFRAEAKARATAPGTVELKLPVKASDADAPPPQLVKVRGQVVDGAGKPVAGARVEGLTVMVPQVMMNRQLKQPLEFDGLVPQAKMMRAYTRATSGADGTFELVAPAELVVRASRGELACEPVFPAAGAPAKLVLTPRSVARGRVVDAAGRPASFFTVNGVEHTSPDGRFEVRLPETGTLTLRYYDERSPIEERTVQVPEAPGVVELGDLKLRQGFTVRGRVLAAETGKPLPPRQRPRLDVRSDAGRIQGAAVQDDGTFQLTRVPPGSLSILVAAEGYAAAAVSTLASAGDVSVKLQRLCDLEVVVTSKGMPAAGARVEAKGPPRADSAVNQRAGACDGEGVLRLAGLTPGEWTVSVRGAAPKKVKLAPGAKQRLELVGP